LTLTATSSRFSQGRRTRFGDIVQVIVIELCAHALEAVGDSLKDLVELIFSQGYTVTDADSLVNLNTVEDVLKAVPANSGINAICLSTS